MSKCIALLLSVSMFASVAMSASAQTVPAQHAPVASFIPTGPSLGIPESDVLVIHSERVFTDSAYGERVVQELEAQIAVLMAENRRIEAELRAEELDLKERRNTTESDTFRRLARDFDAKVQEIRAAQEEKSQEIIDARAAARREFDEVALPILEQIMIETGAAVIIEQSNVILSARTVDITELAIERVNAVVGSGETDPSASD